MGTKLELFIYKSRLNLKCPNFSNSWFSFKDFRMVWSLSSGGCIKSLKSTKPEFTLKRLNTSTQITKNLITRLLKLKNQEIYQF